jgi:hypothetical protein
MEELRPEMRAAFEKEQAAHPPPPALRRSVVASVATQPQRAPALQWATVAVAVLIGIAVVAGLMSSRLAAHRAPVPGSTPKATPVVDYGPPPAGVALLYVHDPDNPAWLIGYDWSGNPRATVKLSPDLAQDPTAVQMAPDGAGFEVGGTYKGGSGIFLDRLGQPVPGPAQSAEAAGAMWADDNQHQCLITFDRQTFTWGLNTELPGQAVHQVAVIARDQSIGQTGISLAACSFHNDRAIVMRTVISSISEVWVLRLSDGKVLSHHSTGAGGANIVASGDAAYISMMPGIGTDFVSGAVGARILRVSDWKVVATPHVANVWGFSGDDSLLLADQQQPDRVSLLVLVDWRSGSVLWHDEGSATLGGFLAQPGGRSFALVYTTSGTVTPGVPDLPATILIVHGDGAVTKFPRLYEPTW